MMRLLHPTVMILLLYFAAQVSFAQSDRRLFGTITDCDNHLPIAGAVIRVVGTHHRIVANSNGKFELFELKPGSYQLHIGAPAYRETTLDHVISNLDFNSSMILCLEPLVYVAPPITVRRDGPGDNPDLAVLTSDSPEFESATSVGNLVENIPDLNVTYSSGVTGEARVSVNGSPSKQVLVLLDGVAINSPVTGEADVNSIPLSALSSVEFVKGVTSGRHGTGVMAGVLRLSTSNAGSRSESRGSVSAGSLGFDYWEVGGSYSARSGMMVGYSKTGETANNDMFFDDPDHFDGDHIVRRRNADYRRTNDLISLRTEIGGVRFNGSYHRFEQQNGIPGFIYQLTPHSRRSESRQMFSLFAERSAGDGSINLGYSVRNYDQGQSDTAGFYPIQNAYNDDLHLLNIRYSTPHLKRLDVRLDGSGSYESFEAIDLLNSGRQIGGVIDRRASVSASIESDVLSSVGGLRTAVKVRSSVRVDWRRLSSPHYSPSSGVHFHADRWLSVDADITYGKSFRPPLYTSLFWDDGQHAVGNADLKPENLEESSTSFGISLPIAGEIAVKTEYRHSYYTDLIYWHRSYDNRFTPRNLSGAKIFTRTSTISWNIDAIGIRVVYTNTDQVSRQLSDLVARDGRQLTYRPRYLQYLRATYTGDFLDAGIRVRDVSRRFIRDANSKHIEGYTVADLHVGVKVQIGVVKLRTQYELMNAGDEKYMLLERAPLPGQTWSISLSAEISLNN